MFKNNVWYNRQKLELDVQTTFCRKKECVAFIEEANEAINRLYSQ